MEGLAKQCFSINLSVMEAFGLYPPEKPTCLVRLQAYFMYILLTFPIPILGLLYLFVQEDFNMDDNAFLIAEIGCQITKLWPFIKNGDRIKKCIHYFESPSFAISRKKQQEIINNSVRVCQRNSTIFLISVVIGNVCWAARPFFWGGYKLPVDVWLPFNPTTEPKVYFSVFLFLATGVAYSSISCAAIDPLIGGLACLAAGQLEVLKDNLQHLDKYAEEEILNEGSNEKFQIIYSKIKQCVQHHNAILRFVHEYEECFSWAVFTQFSGSVLVICFCCLQLSKMEPFTFNFFSMTSFLLTFCAQIYLYCFYGTILFEESNTLTNAIYMGHWYDYDMKSKKTLMVIMEHSKRPIIITAGKILDISVGTFTTILKRSYSLLAVLKNR